MGGLLPVEETLVSGLNNPRKVLGYILVYLYLSQGTLGRMLLNHLECPSRGPAHVREAGVPATADPGMTPLLVSFGGLVFGDRVIWSPCRTQNCKINARPKPSSQNFNRAMCPRALRSTA